MASPGPLALECTPMALFDPITINGMTLRNRLVKSAMGEGMADADHCVTPQFVRLYKRWARGEVGLAITGMMSVLEGYGLLDAEAGLYDDKQIAPLATLAREVHEQGGHVFVQLCHAPPQILRRTAKELGSMSASRGLNRTNFLIDRPFKDGEIREVIRAFGRAAGRAREAGVDGVQLHGAHGYMLSRFLSPRHNHRDDDWGGSFGRRLALLEEVYKAVRRAVGDDYPVTIKLNAHDGPVSGGLTLDQSLEVGRQLAGWGIDAIEVSAGTGDVGLGFYPNRGDIPVDLAKRFLAKELPFYRPLLPVLGPVIKGVARDITLPDEPYFLEEAKLFAESLDVPIIAVGGFRDLETCERVLAETKISMIALARPLLTEPSLPRVWRKQKRSGASCTNCNRCFVQVGIGEPLRCTGFRHEGR